MIQRPWGSCSCLFFHFSSSSEEPPSEGQDTPIYTEFDEDFEEPASPIGQCVAIYHFEGGPLAQVKCFCFDKGT